MSRTGNGREEGRSGEHRTGQRARLDCAAESIGLSQLEMEPAVLVFLSDDLEARRPSQLQEMVRPLPFGDFHAVAGVDLFPGQSDMERVHDTKLPRVGLAGKNHVPNQEPAAGPENPVDFLENLSVIGRRDIHEGEKNSGRVECLVHELEVPGIHDDLEQGFAGSLFELALEEVDGNDLLALELTDDPFSSTSDIQDEALGRKIGHGDLELGVQNHLPGLGTVLRGQDKRGGQEDAADHRRESGPSILASEHETLLSFICVGGTVPPYTLLIRDHWAISCLVIIFFPLWSRTLI